jgi:hypothetical protein
VVSPEERRATARRRSSRDAKLATFEGPSKAPRLNARRRGPYLAARRRPAARGGASDRRDGHRTERVARTTMVTIFAAADHWHRRRGAAEGGAPSRPAVLYLTCAM